MLGEIRKEERGEERRARVITVIVAMKFLPSPYRIRTESIESFTSRES